MKKTYTLDSNIIMENPYILDELHDANIIIPTMVLQELDNNKNDGRLGTAIRIFSRFLDKLHETNYITNTNSIVSFVHTEDDLHYLGGKTNDNAIIHIAKVSNSVLLSNDILVRIKARNIANIEAHGVTQKVPENDLDGFYQGYIEMQVEDEVIDTLYKEKFIDIKLLNLNYNYPHMFIIFKKFYTNSGSIIGKINREQTKIELIQNISAYDVNPKNVQQIMAMNLLMDKDIPLVTLIGKAGSGKTLLSTAAGLEQMENMDCGYKRMLLTKPVVTVGDEIGFLPGDEQEKLAPFMRSYMDAITFLFKGEENLDLEQLRVKIEAMAYMRGRSIPENFIIIDEAQNLTRHEVKTLLTRAGEGAKVVLMGDPDQTDKPGLTKYNNGLTYAVEKFMDQKVSGHVVLKKGVRSELADVASDIL